MAQVTEAVANGILAGQGYTDNEVRQLAHHWLSTRRQTGYIAPRDRYVPPVLFNPFTGEPRDARDVQSDPQGVLIVPPGARLRASQPPGAATPKEPGKVHDCRMPDGRCGICGGDWSVCGCDGMLKRAAATPKGGE